MTKQELIKSQDIIKISPDEMLSSALSKLTTAHDAAFVFSKEDKFLGVVSPYYSLIKSSYPSNAKVEHCLFHPPKLRIDYTIQRIAELLIESKIHYLPLFDRNERFLGIVSARRLINQFKDSDLFRIKISQVIGEKNKPLITVYEDDSISTALSVFKQSKVSKLIVIGRDFKLKGILSYYDLIRYLISPKTSAHRGEREGNRVNFYSLKVRNFAKTYVLTLSHDDSLLAALHLIIDRKIGSVVIVDKSRHPVGIITTRDFLRLLIGKEIKKKLEVFGKNLSEKSRQVVGGFFNKLAYLTKHIPNLSKAKLFVKEEKRGGLFEVVLSLIPNAGHPKVIKKEGKNLGKLLQKIRLKK